MRCRGTYWSTCFSKVVRTREEQIQGKIETTRRQQQESLERREELLQELEMVNQLTRREAHVNETKKMLRKQELDNLVSSSCEAFVLCSGWFTYLLD